MRALHIKMNHKFFTTRVLVVGSPHSKIHLLHCELSGTKLSSPRGSFVAFITFIFEFALASWKKKRKILSWVREHEEIARGNILEGETLKENIAHSYCRRNNTLLQKAIWGYNRHNQEALRRSRYDVVHLYADKESTAVRCSYKLNVGAEKKKLDCFKIRISFWLHDFNGKMV